MARSTLPLSALIRHRLSREVGRIDKHAPFVVALAYPSPYRAGMSSLGFLQIYRAIQNEPGMAVRARVPCPTTRRETRPPVTYESQRPLGEYPGHRALGRLRARARRRGRRLLEASASRRCARSATSAHPFVLAGGPLTFSNPVPLGAVRRRHRHGRGRRARRRGAARAPRRAVAATPRSPRSRATPHVFVPVRHGEHAAAVAQCDDDALARVGAHPRRPTPSSRTCS